MRKLILGSFCLFSIHALSAQETTETDLNHYRSQVNRLSPDEAQTAFSSSAANRALRILELLKQDQRLAALDLVNEVQAGAYIRPLARVSSNYIKAAIERAVRALVTEERYNTPVVFDPGKFSYELDSYRQARRFAIFNTELIETGAYERLIKELYANEVAKEVADKSASAWPTPLEKEIAKKLSELIHEESPSSTGLRLPENAKDPVEAFDYDLFDVLGDLYAVEIQAGRVRRLAFKDEDGQVTKISLSMLITFRTGEDLYFVLANQFLSSHAKNTLEDYYKVNSAGEPIMDKKDPSKRATVRFDSTEERARFIRHQALVPILEADFAHAQDINLKLSRLSPSQIHYLLALLLTLQWNDLPAPGETVYLEDEWSFGRLVAEESERLHALNRDLPNDRHLSFSDALGLSIDQANSDWRTYHDLERQLYQLEEFLVEEQGTRQIQEKRLQRLKK